MGTKPIPLSELLRRAARLYEAAAEARAAEQTDKRERKGVEEDQGGRATDDGALPVDEGGQS